MLSHTGKRVEEEEEDGDKALAEASRIDGLRGAGEEH